MFENPSTFAQNENRLEVLSQGQKALLTYLKVCYYFSLHQDFILRA